jgi:hypothetical protein
MKKYVILALLAASTAQAATLPQLPSTLHCVSDSEYIPEITFSEISLNSGKFVYDMPEYDELEGSSSELYRRGRSTLLFSSNGCDRIYNLRIATRELVALAKGEKTSVTGTQKYFRDTGEPVEETVLVTCTL